MEVPEIGDDEVLVRVAACGLCRTDLHYLYGVPTFKKPPIVLGHKIGETVEKSVETIRNFPTQLIPVEPYVKSTSHLPLLGRRPVVG